MQPKARLPYLADRYAALTRLLGDSAVATPVLAARWGYSIQSLSNARASKSAGGLPFFETPTGGIRYFWREIIMAEFAGTRGPLSIDRIAVELSFMPEVPAELADLIVERLRTVQGIPPEPLPVPG